MPQSPVIDEFATEHFVDVGNARVCYRKAGSGPALVLLHGFPLSGLTWRKLIPALSERFTCYAFDLIGLGRSTSAEAADFSSPGQGRVFWEALSALGVTSYALVGNDTGGWVARELALLDGERVTHLALTNTEIPGHRPPWIPIFQIAVRLPGSSFIMRRMLLSRRFRRSPLGFGGCFENLDYIDGEFVDLFVRPIVRSQKRLAGMFRFLEEMRFGRLDELAQLHGQLAHACRLSLGNGRSDFPENEARQMAEQFPNVQSFRTLPNARLLFYEEHPGIVTDWLIGFAGKGA